MVTGSMVLTAGADSVAVAVDSADGLASVLADALAAALAVALAEGAVVPHPDNAVASTSTIAMMTGSILFLDMGFLLLDSSVFTDALQGHDMFWMDGETAVRFSAHNKPQPALALVVEESENGCHRITL